MIYSYNSGLFGVNYQGGYLSNKTILGISAFVSTKIDYSSSYLRFIKYKH